MDEHGDLVGMLTFREAIAAIVRSGATASDTTVRSIMDDRPMTCTPETNLDQVRPMTLARHTRNMPVMDNRVLTGVISFYHVA